MARKSRKVISRFEGEYRFLSNFYDSPVYYEGTWYPTSEHAFQAAKTLDVATRMAIKEARSPSQAKRMGRQLDLRPMWDDIKIDVMRTILASKFERPELAVALVATDNAVLVEGNTWGDRFWGACIGHVPPYERWNDGGGYIYGHNHLGRLLMELRDKLGERE